LIPGKLSETTGTVLSIERCSLHDGPGLRTTVFLKGCPLSCLWCHNPESKSFAPELYYLYEKCVFCGLCDKECVNHKVTTQEHNINRSGCTTCGKCVQICPNSALEIKGEKKTVQDVVDIVLKDVRYYENSGGGMTLSGGEPLAQFDFTLAILQLAKENGIHTCLETCGYASSDKLMSVMPYVDLFLYDFKATGDDEHLRFTGVPRSPIIENLQTIDKAGAKIILRCPIIPGYNDNEVHFAAISATANALKNIVEVNIMKYNPMGASKAKRIGQSGLNLGFQAEEQIDGWLSSAAWGTNVTVKFG